MEIDQIAAHVETGLTNAIHRGQVPPTAKGMAAYLNDMRTEAGRDSVDTEQSEESRQAAARVVEAVDQVKAELFQRLGSIRKA